MALPSTYFPDPAIAEYMRQEPVFNDTAETKKAQLAGKRQHHYFEN